MIKKILSSFALFSFPFFVWAAEGLPKITNPVSEGNINSIESLLQVIIKSLTTLAIPFIVLAFIWAGFKYAKAQGDSTKIADANKTILITLVAAAIIIASNLILEIVVATTEGFGRGI